MVEDREMGVKWLANAGKIESAMANARYIAGVPTKKDQGRVLVVSHTSTRWQRKIPYILLTSSS